MNSASDRNRHSFINKIVDRHRSYRHQDEHTEKYGLIQRIIILVIIISCIALVATVIGVF